VYRVCVGANSAEFVSGTVSSITLFIIPKACAGWAHQFNSIPNKRDIRVYEIITTSGALPPNLRNFYNSAVSRNHRESKVSLIMSRCYLSYDLKLCRTGNLFKKLNIFNSQLILKICCRYSAPIAYHYFFARSILHGPIG
jgi:hypothetical protein